MTDQENRQANRELMADGYRHARFLLKQANKTMGRQGSTIAFLRGELARLREEHSKIDRGELRRLERAELNHIDTRKRMASEIARLREENLRLREKLDGDRVEAQVDESGQ